MTSSQIVTKEIILHFYIVKMYSFYIIQKCIPAYSHFSTYLGMFFLSLITLILNLRYLSLFYFLDISHNSEISPFFVSFSLIRLKSA